jgi:hypothetical protein
MAHVGHHVIGAHACLACLTDEGQDREFRPAAPQGDVRKIR